MGFRPPLGSEATSHEANELKPRGPSRTTHQFCIGWFVFLKTTTKSHKLQAPCGPGMVAKCPGRLRRGLGLPLMPCKPAFPLPVLGGMEAQPVRQGPSLPAWPWLGDVSFLNELLHQHRLPGLFQAGTGGKTPALSCSSLCPLPRNSHSHQGQPPLPWGRCQPQPCSPSRAPSQNRSEGPGPGRLEDGPCQTKRGP